MQLRNKRTAWLPLVAAAAIALLAATVLGACKPVTATPDTQGPSYPCAFTANITTTVYMLPDAASQVFGELPPAPDQYPIGARTADGWLGFDPGVAQAGNIGLARNRWFLPNATISPSCLDSVPVGTMEQIQADVTKSHE